MKYPVICLIEEDTNHKVFIIPNKNSLIDYAKSVKNNELDKLKFGISVFLSLMPKSIIKEPENLFLEDIQLHSLRVKSIGKNIIKFNEQTLFGANDYDCFFLMNNKPLQSIDNCDLDSISEIVKINTNNAINKQQLKLHQFLI